MNSLNSKNVSLDEVDGRILDALFANARISTAELSRQIGLSSPSTAERLKRLEENGVIDGYTIVVNPRMHGFAFACLSKNSPRTGKDGRGNESD